VAARDYLACIRKRRSERERRRIQEEIGRAEQAGEHERVKQLLAQKQSLCATAAERA
jgi:hypothetical protein